MLPVIERVVCLIATPLRVVRRRGNHLSVRVPMQLVTERAGSSRSTQLSNLRWSAHHLSALGPMQPASALSLHCPLMRASRVQRLGNLRPNPATILLAIEPARMNLSLRRLAARHFGHHVTGPARKQNLHELARRPTSMRRSKALPPVVPTLITRPQPFHPVWFSKSDYLPTYVSRHKLAAQLQCRRQVTSS